MVMAFLCRSVPSSLGLGPDKFVPNPSFLCRVCICCERCCVVEPFLLPSGETNGFVLFSYDELLQTGITV